MGCVSSMHHANGNGMTDLGSEDGSESDEKTHWRIEPQKALNKFLNSGTELLDRDFDYFSDDEFVELRTLLDEPLGRSHFLAHISHYNPGEADLVKMWLLLHSYHHNENDVDDRYQSCKSLYKHYFYITPAQKKAAEEFRESNCNEAHNKGNIVDEDGDLSVDDVSLCEKAFSEYRRLLVPKTCQEFQERVIAAIIHLRPRVETSLWEGRPTTVCGTGVLNSESPRSTGSQACTTRKFSSSIDYFVDIGAPGGIVDISPHGGIGVNANIAVATHITGLGPSSPRSAKADSPPMTSPLVASWTSEDRNDPIRVAFDDAKLKGPGLDLFLVLQNEVFKEMKPLYHHFKETSDDYTAYQKSKKLQYNHVVPNDFRYIRSLGKGGFGQVTHVIKKSTGAHYAMKIQAKDTLVDTWNGKMQHVEIERDVLVAHRSFPYIVSLRYAFQNNKYAFLCLDLAEYGSLRQVLENLPGYQMQVPQVRLYVAEIVLALECLHDHDIIYRDLKPENVLLFADGHIMLADMGLAGFYYQDKYHDDAIHGEDAVDNAQKLFATSLSEGATSTDNLEVGASPNLHIGGSAAQEMADEDDDLFGEEIEDGSRSEAKSSSVTTLSSEQHSGDSSSSTGKGSGLDGSVDDTEDTSNAFCNRKIRNIHSHDTDCGTTLYRPPEMVKHEHYNQGVDFFMLGVFIYECLCATLPWMPKMDADGEIAIDNEEDELKVFHRKLRIPTHLGESTTDIVACLLDLDPERRLGVGPPELGRDLESLKKHPFFVPLGGPLASECDWDKVLERGYKPAVVPGEKELETTPQFSSFEALVKSWKKAARKEARVAAKRNGCKVDYNVPAIKEGKALDSSLERYFDNWDYIDPSSILAEKESEMSSNLDKIHARKSLGNQVSKVVSKAKNRLR